MLRSGGARRDLRLADNPALRSAIDDGEAVLPLFVLDPQLLAPAGQVLARLADGCAGGPGLSVMIDAGMRQLLAEGWMHNRVRMVVASFLIKPR